MQETGTFSENNLTAASTAGTFKPAGASYAKSNAASTSPATTLDFAGATRGNPTDVGALEFTGTPIDASGPDIAFTDLANTYCSNAPTLSATITDNSGVNTISGTKPRLYYKRSTAANAYAGNTSADNGYKFVEANNSTSPFTFTPDYSLLQAMPGPGDVIQYFVVAQDLNGTPNVSALQAGFATGFCPSTVALTSAAFPLAATPVVKSFSILATPTLTLAAAPATICVSGTTTLTITGLPFADPNAAITYEVSTNGGGMYSTISGANGTSYTTGTLTGADNGIMYRVRLNCSGSPIATSNAVTITVNNPQITGTTPRFALRNRNCEPRSNGQHWQYA